MSVRLDTMPWLTKNRAAGSTDTNLSLPGTAGGPRAALRWYRAGRLPRRPARIIGTWSSPSTSGTAPSRSLAWSRATCPSHPTSHLRGTRRLALRRLLGADDTPVALVSVVPAWGVAVRSAAADGGREAARSIADAPDDPAAGARAGTRSRRRRPPAGRLVRPGVDGRPGHRRGHRDGHHARRRGRRGGVRGRSHPAGSRARDALAGPRDRDAAARATRPAVRRDRRGHAVSDLLGVLLGHLGAIGGLLERMQAELGARSRPRVVLTGGDAAALGSPEWADRLEPDLLLRGLGALADLTLTDRRLGAPA